MKDRMFHFVDFIFCGMACYLSTIIFPHDHAENVNLGSVIFTVLFFGSAINLLKAVKPSWVDMVLADLK